MKINEEKRAKFIECAGKRVNNVLHDIQILEPMARSSVYDFTKQDIEEMFSAMQETLNNAKIEFEKKFEEKAKSEKKVFSFGATIAAPSIESAEEATEIIDTDIVAPETNDTLLAAAEDLSTTATSEENLVF